MSTPSRVKKDGPSKVHYSLEDLLQWKVLSLKQFCEIHSASYSNKTKDELAALAYSIQVVGMQPSKTEQQLLLQSASEYQQLLYIGNFAIRDPLKIPETEWKNATNN